MAKEIMFYERFSFTIFTNIATEIMFHKKINYVCDIHNYNYKPNSR